VLTDNELGAKANSPNSLLMFHEMAADWDKGGLRRIAAIFLRDQDKIVPFRITTGTSKERYLTDEDFDPESIQPVGTASGSAGSSGPT
jgi:hypothetical protein